MNMTFGVGLVLSHQTQVGQTSVLLLTELTNKLWLGKVAGMESIPMETCDMDESYLTALGRLMDEELPGSREIIRLDDEIVGDYQIVSGTWLRVYAGVCAHLFVPQSEPVPNDVGSHRWVSTSDALQHSNLRPGAKEPLHDFVHGRKRVRHEACCYCPPDVSEVLS